MNVRKGFAMAIHHGRLTSALPIVPPAGVPIVEELIDAGRRRHRNQMRRGRRRAVRPEFTYR